MHLFRAVLVLAAAVPIALAQEPGVRLWAVGDGVRVSPVTGKLLEGRPDIHSDYPAGDPRAGNRVWDPAAKTVSLKCARNEFCAFQVVIETDQPQDKIDVKLPGLAHSSGKRLEGRNIALFKEWYTQARRASTGYEKSSLGPDWYPDALMPYRAARLNTGFPFSIPDVYNNIPNQKNHAVWVDVFVPYERTAAPPGRYTGQVEVTWKGGKDTLRVALDVWDFALPHQTHLPGDIWNGSMAGMQPDDELRYYQLARQHRFVPLIYAYRPKLSIRGTKVELDWTEFDKRLTRYLDGSAFTSKHGYWGPGQGIPMDHMMLPFDIEKGGVASRARGPSRCRRKAAPPPTKPSGRIPPARSRRTWTRTQTGARS
jgi:hypothetical protein